MKISVTRRKDTVIVEIMKHKTTGLYSFVNLTKSHICPCLFKTKADAVEDLINDKNVISFEVLNEN